MGLLRGSLSSCHWCSLAKQFFAVHPDCENSPPKIVSWKRTVASHPLYFPLHPIVSNVLLSVIVYIDNCNIICTCRYIYDGGLRPPSPPPPEWVGSKTYVLATFSWNPPNTWYLHCFDKLGLETVVFAAFCNITLYTTTLIVLLLQKQQQLLLLLPLLRTTTYYYVLLVRSST